MAPKRATFYSFSNDNICDDAKKFITDAGILLTVRDLSEKPLTFREVKDMIGHIEIKHFLNTASPDYIKLGVEEKLNDLTEMYKIISENNSILRRPIIRTVRLITIGCDRKRLAEMLQISHNTGHVDDSKGNLKNSKYVTRRTTTKSSPGKPESTPAVPSVPTASSTVNRDSVKTKTPSVRATK